MSDHFKSLSLIAGSAVVGAGLGLLLGHLRFKRYEKEVRVKLSGTNKTYSGSQLNKYVESHSLRLHPVQQKLIDHTLTIKGFRMLSSPDQVQLLCNLLKRFNAKKTLDIGVFTGYSSLSVALALPDDGRVVACEYSQDYLDKAQTFWREAGVAHKIIPRVGPALDTLQQLLRDEGPGTYDYAYIDANKDQYLDYYRICKQLLRPGGLIAVDNVLWNGKVADPTIHDDSTEAIRRVNEAIRDDAEMDISLLTLGDGLFLAIKK